MMFCSFVKMILFIAGKDKEKKKIAPSLRAAVIVKEVTTVKNRTKQVKVHPQNHKSTAYCIELNGFLTCVNEFSVLLAKR